MNLDKFYCILNEKKKIFGLKCTCSKISIFFLVSHRLIYWLSCYYNFMMQSLHCLNFMFCLSLFCKKIYGLRTIEMMDFHPFLLGYLISWEFFTFSFLIRAGNLSILFIITWDDIRSRFYGLFEGDFAGGWWKVFDQISRIFKCSTKTNLFYLKI